MELISKLLDWIINHTLSGYGSIASIFGLLISLATLFLVKTLRRQFLFRTRIEEHSDFLGEIASNISSLLLLTFVGNEAEIVEQVLVG